MKRFIFFIFIVSFSFPVYAYLGSDREIIDSSSRDILNAIDQKVQQTVKVDITQFGYATTDVLQVTTDHNDFRQNIVQVVVLVEKDGQDSYEIFLTYHWTITDSTQEDPIHIILLLQDSCIEEAQTCLSEKHFFVAERATIR